MSGDLEDQDGGWSSEETLAVAQIVGRDLLRSEFIDNAYGPAEAEEAMDAVLRDLRGSEAMSGNPGDLVPYLDDAIERLTEFGPNEQEMVRRAAEIAERGAELQGTRNSIAALLGALALLLGLAKLEGRYDWKTGEGYVALSPGIPPGFSDIAKALAESVSRQLRAASDPAPPDGPSPRSTAGEAPAPSSTAESAPPAAPAIRSSSAGRSILDGIPGTETGRAFRFEAAVEIARRVVERHLDGTDLRDLAGYPPEKIFQNDRSILSSRPGWPEPPAGTALSWLDQAPFTVGAGLFSVGESGFGVVVRLQSNRHLKDKFLKEVANYYERAIGRAVAVRWVSPVLLLKRAARESGRWHGPVDGLKVGSPVNVGGECVGTVGLFIKDSVDCFALTSGHSLDDAGAGTPGKPVYFLQQPHHPLDGTRIGSVHETRLPRRVVIQNGSRLPPPSDDGLDYGMIKLDLGWPPKPSDIRRVSGKTFSRDIHPADPRADLNADMIKSPAASRELYGKITATNMTIEAIDPIRGGAVWIANATEVTFVGKGSILPGDSGALIYLDRDGSQKAYGICVGGTKKSKVLPGKDGGSVSTAYVLPLTHLLAAKPGMELA